jgi:carbamoyltransferase
MRPRPDAVRNILSINFNHDGSAVLLSEGRVAAYVNTERFSRVKKHPGLRAEDLAELLDQASVTLSDVDHVMLCNLHSMDSPDVARLHGGDLKETWFEFWVNQTNTVVDIDGCRVPCTVNPDHHLIHAAAAYYTSPFDSGVAVAIDPIGCRPFLGRGNKLYPARADFDSWFTANIAYTFVAQQMFGSGIVGAGKVMGLAPYGRTDVPVGPDELRIDSLTELMRRAEKDPVLVRVGDVELNARLAHYVQVALEQQLCEVFTQAEGLCVRNAVDLAICLSGGTSLNVLANDLALRDSRFDRMHQHPACGDDGTAIGAALWFWHHHLDNPRLPHSTSDMMYSRRVYTRADEERAFAAHADRIHVEHVDDHLGAAARLIADGAVVGWYEGASEVGPRALGHRSILADPRSPTMRDRLNSRIKQREHFRPFGPSVLNDRAVEWFGLSDSPFMLRAAVVGRPSVPAITHVDGTSRPQTVARTDNPAFYDLIRRFDELTGVPLVLNTSLNTKGEPIAETPADAVRTLVESGLDHLVLPHTIVTRRVS